MGHPLRIGYLVPQFPGQTHIYFWREITALEALGHHVDILSTVLPPQQLMPHGWSQEAVARTTYLSDTDIAAGAGALARLLPRGLPLWMARGGVRFSRDVLLSLSAAQRLLSYARAQELDHIHVHSCGRAAVIAALAQRMGGPSYSLTLHGPLAENGPGQRFKWQGASFAMTITEQMHAEVCDALAGALPDRVLVQPLGVDADVLRRDTPYVPPSHGKPVKVFSCGRLIQPKGHQDLMQAMRLLLDQGVDVRLEIAGEDDVGGTGYRRVLEKLLKDLHLRDHVKLLGAISAEAVRDKLMESHLFALAAWQEPLGIAYMEAMACGVPTIGTEAGGVTELIVDGVSGRLVPPRNPRVMAQAIRDLSNDPDAAMRLSQGGRARVEAQFTSGAGAATLVAEIERLRPTPLGIAAPDVTTSEV
ncbi:exopolysaccharide biosynthesis GT4 family glycosyltransferase EpsE [Puniceibacterium sediminis]|uniref:exopolysaccharide biosynthesis GT4 family glycosyltransferase EpsE n=1 Tax=Puniceibacterium sediminis TaxID=1608407 RepID=UPI001FE74190|nr:exopolysaccharide biosynthesis GT4 family glycosyltransferase EpsE [Puniceibacterium sediminis]